MAIGTGKHGAESAENVVIRLGRIALKKFYIILRAFFDDLSIFDNGI
jgi:hypothetical protein